MEPDAVLEAEGEQEEGDDDEVARFESRVRYEKQRNTHEQQVLAKTSDFFALLYGADFPTSAVGRDLSRAEREACNYTCSSLAYTELELSSFHHVFTRLHRLGFPDNNTGRFVDIGSGIGKAVFAASLFHPSWHSCVGIEILTSLHRASLKVKETWSALTAAKESTGAVGDESGDVTNSSTSTNIQFLLGDATSMPWADGTDVVFINATSFSDEMIEKLSKESTRLRGGSFVIITSKCLTAAIADKYYEPVQTENMENSFGQARVHIYKRNFQHSPEFIGDPAKFIKALLSAPVG